MTNDFTAGVGQKQPFNDPELFAVRLHSIRQRPVRMVAEDFEQILVSTLAHGLTQLGYLLHRLWQDFQLNGVFRSMFNQCVTGLKLELAGNFANAYHHIPTKSSARPED